MGVAQEEVAVAPGAPSTAVLPPGLVLVSADDPGRAAAELALSLGGTACLTPAQARAELKRRREAGLAAPREHLRRCRATAAAARADEVEARSALPPGLEGLTGGRLRRSARAVVDAVEEAEAARWALGKRPPLDEVVAGEAHAADAELERARQERFAGIPRANSLLTMANAGAAVVVAGRLVSEAFDPAFFLVGAMPLAALGYTAHTVLGGLRRCRAASRRRWSALRALDLNTMAGLAALEARAAAWAGRAARLSAAEVERERASAAWRALAGEGTAVKDAERLEDELAAVAELGRRRKAAERAWADAAARLQEAEDAPRDAHPPLVVLDAGRTGRLRGPRRTIDELASLAGVASVVVVRKATTVTRGTTAAVAPQPSWADPPLPVVPAVTAVPVVSPAPSPAGATGDLRGRVVAGLQRLRSRSKPPPAP